MNEDVALRDVVVTVTVNDNFPTRGVNIAQTVPLPVNEADSNTYSVSLASSPTATVTVDIGVKGAAGEISVSPSRLFFTPQLYGEKEVTVYAGEDFDAEDDSADLTHTVRGGDYTGVLARTVTVEVDDNDDDPGVTVDTGERAALAILEGRKRLLHDKADH